jgi:hypothetical protein
MTFVLDIDQEVKTPRTKANIPTRIDNERVVKIIE